MLKHEKNKNLDKDLTSQMHQQQTSTG